VLELNDPRWAKLTGGRGGFYDARALLRRFRLGKQDRKCWEEVWDELHHQGDIGEASYAVVPHLVAFSKDRSRDWNLYGFVATLEDCRESRHNPQVPEWLEAEYDAALEALYGYAFGDLKKNLEDVTRLTILEFLATQSGSLALAALLRKIASFDEAPRIVSAYGGFMGIGVDES